VSTIPAEPTVEVVPSPGRRLRLPRRWKVVAWHHSPLDVAHGGTEDETRVVEARFRRHKRAIERCCENSYLTLRQGAPHDLPKWITRRGDSGCADRAVTRWVER
jgi:hypothetical protein